MVIYYMPSSVRLCLRFFFALCFVWSYCLVLLSLWWCGGVGLSRGQGYIENQAAASRRNKRQGKSTCIQADKRTVNPKRHFHACHGRNAHDGPQCKPADILFFYFQSPPCSLLMVRLVDWVARTLNVWRRHRLR